MGGACALKLNYRRTFFIGLAFMSISAFWQMYDSIIPLILKRTFGVGDTLSGAIMALDNVLALFMLPLFGALSDRVDTKIGKRMPFILGGTAVAVLAMVGIPLADNAANFVLFFASLMVALVAMSTYRSPAVALMPDVTPKPLRSQANGIINLMGAVGGVFSLVLIRLLVHSEKPNYLPVFAGTAAFMAVAVAVLFLTVKEKKIASEMRTYEQDEKGTEEGTQKGRSMDPAVQRSFRLILASIFLWFFAYNAVTTAFSKYAQDYLGMVGGRFADSLMLATVAAIIAFIPAGMIAGKIGRRKTILAGITVLGLCLLAASFFKTINPLFNALIVIIGFAWAAINVNSYPMVVEMAKGADIGKYTGYYYTASMSAQILTPIVSGFFMEHVGYWTLFPYATFFSILAFITMSQVRHGDSNAVAAKSKLELFDVD